MQKAPQLESIAVRLRQDGARIAIPESDFRAGILRGDLREPTLGALQILETLQLKVLPVHIPDQNVVDGYSRKPDWSPHS